MKVYKHYSGKLVYVKDRQKIDKWDMLASNTSPYSPIFIKEVQ